MDSSRLTLLSLAVLSSLFLVSAVQKTTSTPRVQTSTSASTTPVPNPTAKWFVEAQNSSVKCILANFNASFLVTYNMTAVKNRTYDNVATVSVPSFAMVNKDKSFCTWNASAMVVEWTNNGGHEYGVRFEFVMDKENNRTVLSEMVLYYDLNDTAVFPNATNVHNVWERAARYEGWIVFVNHNMYYKCDNGFVTTLNETLETKRVWATVTDVKLEAFRNSSSQTFDDPEFVCAGDETTVSPTTTASSTTTTSTTTTASSTSTETSTTTTTTTTQSSTTSKAPETTTPSNPHVAHWAVSDSISGDNCILASFENVFTIQYTAQNSKTGEEYERNTTLTVPQTATVSSSSLCDSGTLFHKAVLALEWMHGTYKYGLQIDFNMTGGMNNQTSVSGIHLQYDLGDASTFDEASNKTTKWQRNADGWGQIATINHGNYLKCDTGFQTDLTETMDKKPLVANMTSVKLEAFRTSKTSTFDDTEEVCSGDQVITTSTMGPSTTTQKPGDGKTYQYNDTMTGKVCLEAHFNLDLQVLYYTTDGKVVNETFNNLNNGSVNPAYSYCHDNSSRLAIIDLLPGWTLYFTFSHNTDKFALDEVKLDFNLANFGKNNYSLPQTSETVNLPSTWGAHLNKSYMCNVQNKWNLNMTGLEGIQAIVLNLENVHVQAFMHNEVFDQAEECSADNGPGGDTSQIVPIAVGCALAALVIIVLIAYVIGRRRNRARGYESM